MKTPASDSSGIPDAQREHWESTFVQKPDMFGQDASDPASHAADLFARAGARRILELGAGQGRDTLFFARKQFQVVALDYSQPGVDAIDAKARAAGFGQSVETVRHDVRQPLPFPDNTFDACYSHMLFCMALTTSELERLAQEIRRVLKPGGLNIYTVRHTRDAHYGTGVPRGDDMYEVGGFIVHFFSRETVERLAHGYEIVSIDEFEEGALPRKLFRVTLQSPKHHHRNDGASDRE